MTELPTSRQGFADRLWAPPDTATQGQRQNLFDGSIRPLAVQPSSCTDLRHGFATVCDFFPGGKELLGRLAERILREAMGGWDPEKAEVFADQYISSGGQLAEVALGRDRFVLDVRPLVYDTLGVTSSLCCRPYDLCTALVATPGRGDRAQPRRLRLRSTAGRDHQPRLRRLRQPSPGRAPRADRAARSRSEIL